MNTNKIIEKAKESYDRYFKDAPVLPDNHEQDVVCNTEEIEKIIEKKESSIRWSCRKPQCIKERNRSNSN